MAFVFVPVLAKRALKAIFSPLSRNLSLLSECTEKLNALVSRSRVILQLYCISKARDMDFTLCGIG